MTLTTSIDRGGDGVGDGLAVGACRDLNCGVMAFSSQSDSWPSPDASGEELRAWAATASVEQRWAWVARHPLPPSSDDTPILAGFGGRRATPEELRAFIAREQERIARGG